MAIVFSIGIWDNHCLIFGNTKNSLIFENDFEFGKGATTGVNNKTPLSRMCSEDDVANAVIFFSSELSSYITGQNLIIDGGYSVS